MSTPDAALDALCINTIRTLSIDGVQHADSGHPGAPMGAAAMAYVLWTRHLRHDPAAPDWINRDRFVLSAGHASMLLYSLLHLTGYDLSIEDLKQFRRWGSRTPGHPEHGHTVGVEVTTGPLGQGFGNAVGLAMTERWLAATFNRPNSSIVDHHTYVLASDGDLMEGIAAEAASLAGDLRLGRLIVLYDANRITLSAHNQRNLRRGCRRALQRLRLAGAAHRRDERRGGRRGADGGSRRRSPALPHRGPHAHRLRQSAQAGHLSRPRGAAGRGGGPADQTGIRLARRPDLLCPGGGRARVRQGRGTRSGRRGPRGRRRWSGFAAPTRRRRRVSSAPWPVPCRTASMRACRCFRRAMARWPHATPGGKAITALAAGIPNLVGGSADLDPSTRTMLTGLGDFQSPATPEAGQTPPTQGAAGGVWSYAGRNIHFGIREHAMTAILTGMAHHGGVTALWRHISHLRRLHAAKHQACGTESGACHLRLDPRQYRAWRGRADSPAGGTDRQPACDAEPASVSAGRRQRDRRGLAAGGAAPGLDRSASS